MYCQNYQIGDLAGPRSPNWRSGGRQVAKLAVLVVQNFWVNFLQFYKVWKVFWHQCRMLYIVSINVVFFVVCCLLCFVVFLDSLVYMVWTKNTKMSFFALFICANTPSQLLWVFMKTYGCQDTFVKFYEIIAWSIRFRPFIIKWP